MLRRVMARQFKLIVLMGVAAFIVCGVAVFYTHRMAHGTTAEEQATYESGEKAGKEAPSNATLPTEDEVRRWLKSISSSRARLNSSKILCEHPPCRLFNT